MCFISVCPKFSFLEIILLGVCKPGHYADKCWPCEIEKYKSSPGQQACNTCPARRESIKRGSIKYMYQHNHQAIDGGIEIPYLIFLL